MAGRFFDNPSTSRGRFGKAAGDKSTLRRESAMEGKGPKGCVFYQRKRVRKNMLSAKRTQIAALFFERIYRNTSELEHGSTFLHLGSFFENDRTAEAF